MIKWQMRLVYVAHIGYFYIKEKVLQKKKSSKGQNDVFRVYLRTGQDQRD